MDDELTPAQLATIAAPLVAQGYGENAALQMAYKLCLEAKKFLTKLDNMTDTERAVYDKSAVR